VSREPGGLYNRSIDIFPLADHPSRKDRVMKVLPLSGASVLLSAAVLGLAGCAWQNAESDPEAMTRVAGWSQPAPEEKAPPARPAISEPKKAPAKPAVAAAPQPRQPSVAGDEASCAGVETCGSVLKAMVAGTDRSWVQRPAPPKVIANGVRLFAYRALKPALTCGELSAALSEVRRATSTFASPVAGFEPEKAARVKQLSAEVADELKAERAQRCPGENGSVG